MSRQAVLLKSLSNHWSVYGQACILLRTKLCKIWSIQLSIFSTTSRSTLATSGENHPQLGSDSFTDLGRYWGGESFANQGAGNPSLSHIVTTDLPWMPSIVCFLWRKCIPSLIRKSLQINYSSLHVYGLNHAEFCLVKLPLSEVGSKQDWSASHSGPLFSSEPGKGGSADFEHAGLVPCPVCTLLFHLVWSIPAAT